MIEQVCWRTFWGSNLRQCLQPLRPPWQPIQTSLQSAVNFFCKVSSCASNYLMYMLLVICFHIEQLYSHSLNQSMQAHLRVVERHYSVLHLRGLSYTLSYTGEPFFLMESHYVGDTPQLTPPTLLHRNVEFSTDGWEYQASTSLTDGLTVCTSCTYGVFAPAPSKRTWLS